MGTKLRRLPGALGMLVLAGCVSTNAVQLDPGQVRAPVCPDAVQIFTDSSHAPAEYVEVALLSSSGNTGSTSEKGMYESQRKKAAKMGANGLILSPISEPKAGTKIIGALFGIGAERKGHATAIWIPADSARVTEMCDGVQNKRS